MKIFARTLRPHQYKAQADFALEAYWNTVRCKIGMERSSDAACASAVDCS